MKSKRGKAHYVAKFGREKVSVYKRFAPDGSPCFMVANYSSGKRRFDSYASEAEAVEAANRLARLMSQRNTKAAQLTEGQAVEYVRSAEVLHPFKVTVGAAAEALAGWLGKVGDITAVHDAVSYYASRHKKITDKLVADVVTDLLDVKEKRGKSTRYLKDIRSRLKNKFAGSFKCNIGKITTPMLQAWLDSLNCESQTTYKNIRQLLHMLFNFAVTRGYAAYSVVTEVERADIRDTDEVGHYSPAEIAKLLQAAPTEFLPCIAIGAFAGLRSAEIQRLEWSDIDLVDKKITIRKGVAKTAMRRTIPISDNLLEWLNPYAKRQGNVWTGSHNGYYETQQATSLKAQVDWVHNGLRHSFGSYRYADLHGDAGRLAGEMGNTPAVLHRHYREPVKPADAVKWFNVKPAAPANVVTLATSNG